MNLFFVNLASPFEEDGLLRTPGWVVPTEAACSGDVFICLRDHVGEDDGGWEKMMEAGRGQQALEGHTVLLKADCINFRRSVLPTGLSVGAAPTCLLV